MSNLLFHTECALLDKKYENGLSSYTQSNCQVTLMDNGYHIYRPPNLVYPDCGNTVWGGLKLDFSVLPSHLLLKGHTYIILFNVKGQSSNAANIGWTHNMGWGGGGLTPSPSNVSYGVPEANFSGEKQVFYQFTISDDIYKTCTSSYSSFAAGQRYLSYKHFYYQYGYSSTGTLGTDLYLTNFRMYDITETNGTFVKKTGVLVSGGFVDGYGSCSFGGEVKAREIIEL